MCHSTPLCPNSFTCKCSLCHWRGSRSLALVHLNTGPPLTFLSDVLLLPAVTETLQLWFCSIPSHTPAVQRGRYWGVPWMCAWVAAELVSLGNWDSSSRARGRTSSLGQGEGVGQAFPRECLLGAGPAFPCKLITDLKQ